MHDRSMLLELFLEIQEFKNQGGLATFQKRVDEKLGLKVEV